MALGVAKVTISNFWYFSLTSQTALVFVRTLLCHAFFIEGYEFVLTSRFQDKPLARGYRQYIHMSGGRSLIGLKADTLSKKMIKIKSFWKEWKDIDGKVKPINEGDVKTLQHLAHDFDTLSCTADEWRNGCPYFRVYKQEIEKSNEKMLS